MSRTIRVETLAGEAKMNPDDALLALWEAGFTELDSQGDVVRSKRVAEARAVLQIVPPKEQTRIDYWLKQLKMTRIQFSQVLSEMNIILPKNARKLPKGALRKLRRRFPQYKVVTFPDKGSKIPESNVVSHHPSLSPGPPFKWRIIGPVRPIQYLSQEEVLSVHEALVKDFARDKDPIKPHGVRDTNLLSSAVERPQTGLIETRKYPTVEMAGAALLHSIVLNHAFYNGNKRTALVCLLVFLDKNSLMPEFTEDDLFKLTLNLAQHRLVPKHYDHLSDREVIELAEWIRQRSRRINKEERPLSWLKLKRILRYFDCEFDPPKGTGNRINIKRVSKKRSRFGRERDIVLKVPATYRGDGTEVVPYIVKYIRENLELDEQHGYDSVVFYNVGTRPDDFIQKYRTLLRRLARL